MELTVKTLKGEKFSVTAEESNTIEEVKDIFSTYLEKNGLRRTSERFAILEEIYSREDHFEAETLYIDIKNKNFNVSREFLSHL